jgi:hypothetical protein
MYCYGQAFNQENKRTWSRRTLNCQPIVSLDPTVSPELLRDLHKGNVLQYFKNSARLTKQQRYAQISRGYWTNRTTTWASQTQDYTNPNTRCLLRTNTVDIIISGDPNTSSSVENLSCINPYPIIVYPSLPPIAPTIPDVIHPPIIPPIPTDQSGGSNNIIPILPIVYPPVIIYPDGGSLICSIIANPCTGETINTTQTRLCYPTTDSDVPGSIQLLCWNNGSVENLYMIPGTPSITNIVSGDGIIDLVWNAIPGAEYYTVSWS